MSAASNNNNRQLHGQYWTVSNVIYPDKFSLKHFNVLDFDYPPVVLPIGSVYIRPTKILGDISTRKGEEKLSFDGSSHFTGRSVVDGAGYVGKGLTIKGDVDVSRDEKHIKIATQSKRALKFSTDLNRMPIESIAHTANEVRVTTTFEYKNISEHDVMMFLDIGNSCDGVFQANRLFFVAAVYPNEKQIVLDGSGISPFSNCSNLGSIKLVSEGRRRATIDAVINGTTFNVSGSIVNVNDYIVVHGIATTTATPIEGIVCRVKHVNGNQIQIHNSIDANEIRPQGAFHCPFCP